MEEKLIDFNKGTLSFKIPKGVMNYGDNKYVSLINYSSKKGSIKIVKDKDNGIKVFYLYHNNGKCNLEAQAAELDNENEHIVAFTWSMEDREAILYIDNEERMKSEIDISL